MRMCDENTGRKRRRKETQTLGSVKGPGTVPSSRQQEPSAVHCKLFRGQHPTDAKGRAALKGTEATAVKTHSMQRKTNTTTDRKPPDVGTEQGISVQATSIGTLSAHQVSPSTGDLRWPLPPKM